MPLGKPFFGGPVVGRVGCRVDSSMDDAEFFPGYFRVVFEDVVLYAGGYADDGFSFCHDSGVGVDGVESMYGGDELGATGWRHFSPGQPSDPGGDAGAGVEDVGFFRLKNGTQGANL